MPLYKVVGKGIIRPVSKSKDGESIVILPGDWSDIENVRIYQLKQLFVKKNNKNE